MTVAQLIAALAAPDVPKDAEVEAGSGAGSGNNGDVYAAGMNNGRFEILFAGYGDEDC